MIALAPTTPRMLVVDDDVVILRTIKRYLKDYEVTCVETGAEAVEAAARVQPDMILLDFNLPDSTGIEVMRTLRANGLRAPVLLMSGAFDSGAGAESLAYEADDYIAKSVLREALMRKLDRLLSEHELARKVARQLAELVELQMVEPGDRVFVCSDGLPACRNPDGALLGMGAVCNLVSELRPPCVIEAMHTLIREFTDGQPPDDDVSMIEVVI